MVLFDTYGLRANTGDGRYGEYRSPKKSFAMVGLFDTYIEHCMHPPNMYRSERYGQERAMPLADGLRIHLSCDGNVCGWGVEPRREG